MKKWISILCITLLLCSALTVAVSAAGTGTQKDPIVFSGADFNMVKIPAGATYYISYTDIFGNAKSQISINSSTDVEAGYTVTYGDAVVNSDVDGFCNIVAAPDANYTYNLSIKNNSTKQATIFISFYAIAPYEISDLPLYEGENAVTTLAADTTLYVFEPTELAIYEIAINKEAVLSHWNGSVFYVTGLNKETTEGKLEVTCSALGQSLLIGVSGVAEANITITKIDDYVPAASVEYVEYVNKHTPVSGFKLPDGEMVAVDITVDQTVVLGTDGYYHFGSANGPILYVDMTGTTYADLYECFYPSSGDAADRLRGTYLDAEGKTCGYDFITAMKAYADALDDDGYYYLTEDLANYLQMYGKDQGWYNPVYSPFASIQSGNFAEESAWLLTSCYAPATDEPDEPSEPDDPADPDEPSEPDTPVTPDEPDTPDEPSEPDTPVTPDEPSEPEDPSEPDAPNDDNDEPESPATGDVASLGAIATLLVSAIGTLTFSKKRK